MQSVNFKEIAFEPITICGIEGLFTSLRVDKSTIPEGYNKYSIRHSDEGDQWFCTLEKFVWANHCGDFITKEDIHINDCIYIEDNYNFK